MKAVIVIAPTVPPPRRHRLRELLDSATAKNDPVEILDIPAAVNIAEAAAVCREGYDRVIAMGGDGTVAAVSQALAGTDVPLGILPAGTGNLVAREVGIPMDFPAALRSALDPEARIRRIDAMRINERLFLLNAGVGVNAATIDRTSRLGKTLFGRSAYVGTAVWEALRTESVPLELSVDGVPMAFRATDVLISNCGGLARILYPNGPEIRPDDGKLDLCIVCVKTPLEYPGYYFRRWLFGDRTNKIIHEMTASRRIVVSGAKSVAIQADGDIIGRTPVTIDLLPRAVAVLTPAGAGRPGAL